MEVAFEPYKKISFQSYLRYKDANEFARVIALANPQGIPFQARLFWANGILFRFFPLPPSNALVKEQLNGRIVWDHIEYAPMPEHKAEIKIDERPMGKVVVADMTNHFVFEKFAAWVRDNLPRD